MLPITTKELQRRFGFHKPKTQKKSDRHTSVRLICEKAAEVIVSQTGAPSREQSIAITKLEEAMFWANAAIAREADPQTKG